MKKLYNDTFPSYRLLANICCILALVVFVLFVHTVHYNEELLRELQAENAMLIRSAQMQQAQLEQLQTANPQIIVQMEEPTGDAIAIRNKNPLNIKCFNKDDPWVGQIGTDKFGHAIFESWEYGFRAASITLRSYARKHKIDTISGVVKRFAEGNRDPYIRYLSRKLGVGPDEKIDLIEYMPQLLRHMARFESGQDMPERFLAPYDILAKL